MADQLNKVKTTIVGKKKVIKIKEFEEKIFQIVELAEKQEESKEQIDKIVKNEENFQRY